MAQAAAAQAPTRAAPPPPGVFPVFIETAEADSHPTYLLGYESAPPFVRCEGACSLWAYPARYTLSVRGEGYSESSRSFELTRPSRVLVEPRTTGQRNGGLVLGIVGIGLAVIGAAMVRAQTTPSATTRICSSRVFSPSRRAPRSHRSVSSPTAGTGPASASNRSDPSCSLASATPA
ncbi:MAG TPA: hypothetical protein VM686_07815 [Polyangiaceae bacterium]|nr:hypothetical protein [Polyangiaceae bacterium]